MKNILIPFSPQIILDGDEFTSFDFLLINDCILSSTNFRPGITYTITVTQDAIGGRSLKWPSSWRNMSSISSSPDITSRQQVHVHSDGTVAACGPITNY